MAVAKNLQGVRARLAQAVAKSPWQQPQCTLVAVSKTKPNEDLLAAYEQDQRHFGENYVRPRIDSTGAVCGEGLTTAWEGGLL
ncbi:hypothetical protein ATCC90586_011597 [Pythium insidiosum]|nr:hypothetical protein ATCC90586_011597 [Pythium insidiosum]